MKLVHILYHNNHQRQFRNFLSYIATFVVDEQKGINHMISFGITSGNLSQYVTEIELGIIIVLFLVFLVYNISDSNNSNPNTNTNSNTITITTNDDDGDNKKKAATW